jgi:hypothetical protein
MQHLKTMNPEIVVNLQDSKLYSLTPLAMAQWYSPWDLNLGVANRLSIKSAIVLKFFLKNCTLSTQNCIQGL